MRVTAQAVDWEALAADNPFVRKGQHFVTPGTDYLVLGMSVFEQTWFVLVRNDHGDASLEPLELFEQRSTDIPDDWICTLQPGDGVDLLLGPAFFAADLASYSRFVDQELAAGNQVLAHYDRELTNDT
jgi:hypothetical protein